MKKLLATILLLSVLLGLTSCTKNVPPVEEQNSLAAVSSNSLESNISEQSESDPISSKNTRSEEMSEENPKTSPNGEETVDIDDKEVEAAIDNVVNSVTAADKEQIFTAIQEQIRQYQANNGISPGDNEYEPRFAPFPSDGVYPNPKIEDIVIRRGNYMYPIQVKLDAGNYAMSFSLCNIRDNWCVEMVSITDKKTGELLKHPAPKYTIEEREKFHNFLLESLDEKYYADFDVFTSGKEPTIWYVEGFEDKIDQMIAQYRGVVVETKRIPCQYSLSYLKEIQSELNVLSIVKKDPEHKISSIFPYEGKLQIILNADYPEFKKSLSKYPSKALDIRISETNPDT